MFILLFLCLILNFYLKGCTQLVLSKKDEDNKLPWCWTKPESKYVHENMGGYNWGYCEKKIFDEMQKINYRFFVNTASIEGSEAEGQFFVEVFGYDGQTSEALLTGDYLIKNLIHYFTATGFQKAQTTMIALELDNVGDLYKLKLKNAGPNPYRCVQIRVEAGPKYWDFDCEEFISTPKHPKTELKLSGNLQNKVFVKTLDTDAAETRAPVYIQFIGVNGKSNLKFLSQDGFKRGSLNKMDIYTQDLGYIYGIIVSTEEETAWKADYIQIQVGATETTSFEFSGKILGCPAACSITISKDKPAQIPERMKVFININFVIFNNSCKYIIISTFQLNDKQLFNFLNIYE